MTVFLSFFAGHLTVISLRKVFESLGYITFSDEQLRSLIHEVDLDMSSTIDLEEFLKVSQLTHLSPSDIRASAKNNRCSEISLHYHNRVYSIHKLCGKEMTLVISFSHSR